MPKLLKWPFKRSRDAPEDKSARGAWSGFSTGSSLTNILSAVMPSDLGTDVIYAAVTRIAGALATMPVSLYKGTELQADDPLHWLVHLRANRMMSAYTFKRAVMGWVLTQGTGYAAKVLDDAGRVRELRVLDPRWVTPMIEEESGELWYVVNVPGLQQEVLHSWYVLAFHHMTLDGVSALRPVDILNGAVKYVEDVRTFSLTNLGGINRGIVLEYPTELAGGRREASVREFFELYKKTGGQIIALDAGVKAQRMDGSPFDAGLDSIEKLTRSRVATVYNLPPHLLGDYSDATAASIEQQTIEFLTLTMQPIVQQWEEELDFKLLGPEQLAQGFHFHIDVEAYLRGDTAAMATRDQSSIRTGKRTVNDLRRRDYLPPVPGGDVAMISKDLAPVEMVARGATIDANQLNGEKNS
ncbi:MAG: phage portal protein [Clostridia bacterium]|nr:phage portal protein [Clostridia bacterium]